MRSVHELVLSGSDIERIFTVSGYTLGFVHDFIYNRGLDVGLGAQFTINGMPDRLERYYGDDLPYSFQVFLRVRPSRLEMSHGGHGRWRIT